VALYGLTHITLDDSGKTTIARVRGMNPNMPEWMGKAVDMEASGVAALIGRLNKVVAVFDITEDRPRAVGGTVHAVKDGGKLSLELSTQTPGRAMTDLPRIEREDDESANDAESTQQPDVGSDRAAPVKGDDARRESKRPPMTIKEIEELEDDAPGG
jgi:hypothetical protein